MINPCTGVFFFAYVLMSLRLVDVRTGRTENYKQKITVKTYKTEIQSHNYPGLAYYNNRSSNN